MTAYPNESLHWIHNNVSVENLQAVNYGYLDLPNGRSIFFHMFGKHRASKNFIQFVFGEHNLPGLGGKFTVASSHGNIEKSRTTIICDGKCYL